MNTIYITVGKCHVKIVFHPHFLEFAYREMIDKITFLYKGFISTKPLKPDLTIHFYHVHGDKYEVRKGNKVYTICYEYKSKTEIATTYDISIFQFQQMIHENVVKLLAEKRATIIHASGVADRNGGYIFLGKSGAGKSTAMKLLKKTFTPLADDTIFLLKEGNDYLVNQTPFYEKEWLVIKQNIKCHLSSVFFIHKSQQFKIVKENNREIITKLLLKQFISDKKKNDKYLQYMLDFALNYKHFYHLFFAKDDKMFTNLIKKHSQSLSV